MPLSGYHRHGVGVCETHRLPRNSSAVWKFGVPGAVGAASHPPHVVDKEGADVWPSACGRRGLAGGNLSCQEPHGKDGEQGSLDTSCDRRSGGVCVQFRDRRGVDKASPDLEVSTRNVPLAHTRLGGEVARKAHRSGGGLRDFGDSALVSAGTYFCTGGQSSERNGEAGRPAPFLRLYWGRSLQA